MKIYTSLFFNQSCLIKCVIWFGKSTVSNVKGEKIAIVILIFKSRGDLVCLSFKKRNFESDSFFVAFVWRFQLNKLWSWATRMNPSVSVSNTLYQSHWGVFSLIKSAYFLPGAEKLSSFYFKLILVLVFWIVPQFFLSLSS